MDEDVQGSVIHLIVDQLGVDAKDISLNSRFVDDLGVGSVGAAEVVVALEERFGIMIPDEDVEGLETVGDAVAYLTHAQARQA